MLYKTLCLFNDHLCNLNMAGSLFIECRCNHFTLDITFHVSDFLWSLINKEDKQSDLWMIGCYGIGYLLQKNRLSGSRWCRDQRTLALSNRAEGVDDSHGDILTSTVIGHAGQCRDG